jgi:hypothetical protein
MVPETVFRYYPCLDPGESHMPNPRFLGVGWLTTKELFYALIV